MSMPEFPKPNPELTQEQALTMILSSIALEEVALSHIINAEGEKIQHILKQVPCGGHPADLQDILAVNQSVATLLEMVLQNQMILKNKLDKVLEYLPKPPRPPEPPYPPYPPGPPCPPYPPHPPHPPCPPEPPRPPVLPCMTPGCCPFGQGCLGVAPKTYCSGTSPHGEKNTAEPLLVLHRFISGVYDSVARFLCTMLCVCSCVCPGRFACASGQADHHKGVNSVPHPSRLHIIFGYYMYPLN